MSWVHQSFGPLFQKFSKSKLWNCQQAHDLTFLNNTSHTDEKLKSPWAAMWTQTGSAFKSCCRSFPLKPAVWTSAFPTALSFWEEMRRGEITGKTMMKSFQTKCCLKRTLNSSCSYQSRCTLLNVLGFCVFRFPFRHGSACVLQITA